MVKTLVILVTAIGGGMGYAIANFQQADDVKAAIVTADHVPMSEFKQYIDQQQIADEREYVRALREDIRRIKIELMRQPDNEYLLGELDTLIFDLCEVREDDKLCEDE